MGHQLNVFDSNGKKMGSLFMMVGGGATPNQPTFLWQWEGKGGSSFGQWEWRSGRDWRIVLTKFFDQSMWGTLYGDWKSLPTPQSYPQQPWFSKVGVKSGEIRVNTPANFSTWKWALL